MILPYLNPSGKPGPPILASGTKKKKQPSQVSSKNPDFVVVV
jgi:hypothetical protein